MPIFCIIYLTLSLHLYSYDVAVHSPLTLSVAFHLREQHADGPGEKQTKNYVFLFISHRIPTSAAAKWYTYRTGVEHPGHKCRKFREVSWDIQILYYSNYSKNLHIFMAHLLNYTPWGCNNFFISFSNAKRYKGCLVSFYSIAWAT